MFLSCHSKLTNFLFRGSRNLALHQSPIRYFSSTATGAQTQTTKQTIASPLEFTIPVKAFYIAQKIEHKNFALECFSEFPHRVLQKSSLITFPNKSEPKSSTRVAPSPHVCILSYGSIVMYNCDEDVTKDVLAKISKYCQSPIITPRTETYDLILRSSLDRWFTLGPDYVILNSFSLETIRTITDVLGQTVALQHFEKEVENMLLNFTKLNSEVGSKGHRFFSRPKKDLFQVIAYNNTVLTDVILTLNLLDRPETAWKYSEQSDLWDALRREFDIVDRFKALEFKLSLVSDNCQFFLNMLHSAKSSRLEIIIIILISFEVLMGLSQIFLKSYLPTD
eukprot:c12114_g1_i1.p1 GENE.c12114_g1_i1~~c12114_g1_i1.p1  ORF type:complete len:336 (+),score=114.95 c12114_g1_i1:5-1012(+)